MRFWIFAFFATCILQSLCACVWSSTESDSDYLPFDDSEFPYAGLPRVVIETENFSQIRDQSTEHPAKLQIFADSVPLSSIMELSIKGRGNSSFTGMPKASYKIKFAQKQGFYGMPKDRDWVLLANSSDRTFLNNFITYKLSSRLSKGYSPKAKYVELYLNRQYQGIYLLAESIKVSEERVNIQECELCFLVEKGKYFNDDDVFIKTNNNHLFFIKSKNKNSPQARESLKKHLDSLESKFSHKQLDDIDQWISLDDYITYYWIQEFSKNLDGNFYKSIYFTYEKGGPIKFGPVWDFDLAYGNTSESQVQKYSGWYVKDSPWNRELLSQKQVIDRSVDFWHRNLPYFEALVDTIDKYSAQIRRATDNEFKRWPTLSNTENWMYNKKYDSYDDAVEDLKQWIKSRITWINENLGK